MDDPARGEEDLLEALVLARRRVPGLRALMVGDGPRRVELETRSRALGLAEAVHFVGYRPDVPAVLARGAVGVRCTREAEGVSRAVLEAMAARLPLVVTDVGANPELVADTERGLVVPPASPEALADALVRVLEDRRSALRRADRARAFVAERLSVARMAAEHEALYRRVAAR
jgi:glycosyltransferase involved in cell wall biosynthesis